MVSLLLGSLPIPSQSAPLASCISFFQSQTLATSLPSFAPSSSLSSISVAAPPSFPSVYCGRGDKKTERGKRFNHSYGNARPRDKKKGRGPPRVPIPSSPPRKDKFDSDEKIKIEIDEIQHRKCWEFMEDVAIGEIMHVKNLVAMGETVLEITEEKNGEGSYFIDPGVQKEKIRRIIEYQKSLFLSSASSSSISSASSSTISSSAHQTNSLFNLMKSGRTSLRRLFDMEHTSLETYFKVYSGSPIIKPILLWGSESENEIRNPWASIKQFRLSNDAGNDGVDEFNSECSIGHKDFDPHNRNVRIWKRKLTRKKSYRRLPRFGLWKCSGYIFKLRLRKFRIVICRRK